MNTTCKRLLVPGAFASLAAMALISAGQDQNNGPNAIPGGAIAPAQSSVPGTAAGGASHLLVAMSYVGATSRDAYLVTVPAFSSTLINNFALNGSGLDKAPGTRDYYTSGGMFDGGNLYKNGVLVGATGWTSVPGLAFTPDGSLWGSAAVSIIGDGLISIDPNFGTGTLVGGGYGGPGGVDAIAWNPSDSTMYASTGFFYDGSPGDVLTINTVTGIATDGGVDMVPLPPTVVGGMAFADDGQGYISIGNIDGGIWEFDEVTAVITFLGTVGFNSATDIAVAR